MVPRAKVPAPRLDDWTSTVQDRTFTIFYRTSTVFYRIWYCWNCGESGRSCCSSCFGAVWWYESCVVTTPLVIRTALPTDPGYFLFRYSDLKHPSICSVCCLDFPWPGNVRTPFSGGETATHFPGNDHHCVVLQVRPAIVSTAFFSTGNY